MTNNSALIVPAQPAASNQTAGLTFHDVVKPPMDIPNGWLWFWSILSLLALALAAYFLWRHWQKKASMIPQAPPVPPHVRARRKLEQALALISEPKPFSTQVSDTLRIYLEERFNFHAPDRTTEEFLYELQGTRLLTPDQKQSLADFLSNCDLVKFAKYEPTEVELRALHASALRLVNETEPSPVAPETLSAIPANAMSGTATEPATSQPAIK
jgi:hypothetical protein